MAKTNIFLLGATGFIGGTILDRLLQHPDSATFNISLLVRSEEKAAKFKDLNLGLNAVVGSTDDSDLLGKLAAEADVVILVVSR